jgi:hypothetical protein
MMSEPQEEIEILGSFNTSWGLVLTINFLRRKNQIWGRK